MKKWLFILFMLSAISVYADDISKEEYYKKDKMFSQPCNYYSQLTSIDCYEAEVRGMQQYFKEVPAKMRAKRFGEKRIAAFQRQQTNLNRRVKRDCDRKMKTCQTQGSGCGVLYWGEYYRRIRPFYQHTKKMLGEKPQFYFKEVYPPE